MTVLIYRIAEPKMLLKSEKPSIRVTHKGRASFARLMRYTTPFPVDLFRFPFDQQDCTFSYSSKAYTKLTIDITSGSSELSAYGTVTGWQIANSSIKTYDVSFGDDDSSFVTLKVNMTLKRQSYFYVIALVVPGIFLSSLPLVILCLPPEGTDKVGHGKLCLNVI